MADLLAFRSLTAVVIARIHGASCCSISRRMASPMMVSCSVTRMYGLLEVSTGVSATSAHEYSWWFSGMSYSLGLKIEWMIESARGFQFN